MRKLATCILKLKICLAFSFFFFAFTLFSTLHHHPLPSNYRECYILYDFYIQIQPLCTHKGSDHRRSLVYVTSRELYKHLYVSQHLAAMSISLGSLWGNPHFSFIHIENHLIYGYNLAKEHHFSSSKEHNTNENTVQSIVLMFTRQHV